jgi:NAD(P)-dependent dehydrogenase (short-subunit alcohol dehydrogenase family)
MQRAFELRRLAEDRGDQPYGAVVVRAGRIVGEGVSAVNTAPDPTAHAEMQAIRDAARRLRTPDLSGCELYGTSRACPMCQAGATGRASPGSGTARPSRTAARRDCPSVGRLDGRVAIVTGGAKGIGRHYSLALAQAGASVVVADIVDAADVVEAIARAHGRASVMGAVFDVSDETSVKTLVARAVERFGRIDVLVNNAALFAPLHQTKCTEIDAGLWDRVMAVNLRGPFLMVKHVAPHMIARGYGKIINVGSGTAYRGIPWMLHYVTSKGGILAFTRALSRELGEHGIRVNTLSPGFILSDTVVAENPEHVATARPSVLQIRALKRDAYPEDLLGALVFLASAESDFITGQTLAVDGGSVNT